MPRDMDRRPSFEIHSAANGQSLADRLRRSSFSASGLAGASGADSPRNSEALAARMRRMDLAFAEESAADTTGNW
jgi:hypothetical protein